jgi:hypothetical protein
MTGLLAVVIRQSVDLQLTKDEWSFGNWRKMISLLPASDR